MNRRDFMGSVVAGIAMSKLGMASTSESREDLTGGNAVQRASWIENGIIDAGGFHEPYLFIVRRGGQRLDARQMVQHLQSEAVIRRLKSQGVEVFHIHLYKGFGMIAEKSEMEDTVRASALAHSLGMKVDTYIQWSSLMYETFFAEEPHAQEWIQRDALGQPIMLWYDYQQSFRYLPCFANQAYIDYLKKVVRYALEEVRTDFIHFDNFALTAEPYSCHCDVCRTGFRDYLRTKYSAPQREDRFGFENVDYVNPPLWNRFNSPENLDVISDPVLQEWIEYRCQTMTNALSQMVEFIKSFNPEVVVEVNCGGVVGDNTPWTRGTDLSRILKLTQVFWDESDLEAEYQPDGRLITAIRTYKVARAYRNVALTNAAVSEVAIAECLAFNQTVGFAGVDPLSPTIVKYISFYRRLRDLYTGTADVASVAVLRSYPSIAYHNSAAGLSAILMEQTLIHSKIPFVPVFDEHLSQLSPAIYKVLILPDSECLSDEQVAAIRRYVETGGGLVVTEQAGFYDSWRRERITPGLAGLIDYHAPATYKDATRICPTRKEFGQGRVAYFPMIEFDGSLPPAEPYFVVGTTFWKRPGNWKELMDAVRWAARDKVELQVFGPDFLGANLVEQRERRRRLIHLVNYNIRDVPNVEKVEVKCAVPADTVASAVELYSPDADAHESLSFRMQGGEALFTVPEFQTYCVVTVNW